MWRQRFILSVESITIVCGNDLNIQQYRLPCLSAQRTNQPRDGQGHLLSCSGQLKTIIILTNTKSLGKLTQSHGIQNNFQRIHSSESLSYPKVEWERRQVKMNARGKKRIANNSIFSNPIGRYQGESRPYHRNMTGQAYQLQRCHTIKILHQMLNESDVTHRFKIIRFNIKLNKIIRFNPTPKNALFVRLLVRIAQFLHHLTRTHTCEHMRQILGHTAWTKSRRPEGPLTRSWGPEGP